MSNLSPSDLSILVVEPSRTQQKFIAKELAKEDITHVDFADGVQAALDKISNSEPDLITSAMYYEDGTALELVQQLKSTERFADIPFMLVSSEHKKEQLEVFRQSGVVAILPKPFTPEHLGTALNTTIDLISTDEMELNYFDIKSVRVLVVDDSRMARNFISRVLTNLGIEKITQVTDGSEAIEILGHEMFDLVVTDYNMPEVNGEELTRFIRTESGQSHVPILMVSSEANDTHLANIEKAGVNALCDKPFESDNVRKILYNLLEGDD
ncbi:response regulator [Psychrosphaera sp.]|nr:response regulator [Psychrosphaera sp.]